MLLVYILLLTHTVLANNLQYRNEKEYLSLEDAEIHFESFIKTYNKSYENDKEKATGFENFKKSMMTINEMNENDPYSTFEINKFSDLTSDEFIAKHTGFRADLDDTTSWIVGSNENLKLLPLTFDWRDRILIPIKDQMNCGSCWAFAATANIEAQYAIKYNRPILLSEQQLVDCDFSSNGCKGGHHTRAFSYLIRAGGQETSKAYPYEYLQRTCRFDLSQTKVRVINFHAFNLTNEEEIKEKLINYGPIAASIDARTLEFYTRGVLSSCGFIDYTHAVLIVGYGTDHVTGLDYWVIKNSWGTTWGEAGFFRVMRGINACGILSLNLATAVIL